MNEEQRKVMRELYKKDANFRALLWEIHRLEIKNKIVRERQSKEVC